MDHGIIASRYARAIFQYASKKGKAEKVTGYFHTLAEVQNTSPRLVEAIKNPALSNIVKEQLLMVAAGAGADETFQRIISLILLNKREQFIPLLSLHYEALYKRQNNQVDVFLTTAVRIDEETIKQMTIHMEHILHKRISLHTFVNSELIGGYMMEWDSNRYDASVRNQLQMIKKQLTKANLITYGRADKSK